MIRLVKLTDAKDIVDIYNYYILNTNITFEEEELTIKEMEKRIREKTKKYPWLVYEEDKKVLGYAYLSQWKERSSYRYSCEASIYLHKDYKGKGLGTKLYEELLKLAKEINMHIIISGITIPNEASIKLHERLGFEKVAEFKEVGFKNNSWLNVGYWQKKI
ncbi:GNAT family N-acetyltransferase [Clostridium isatidis]|uniref:Phosphinothricin acetyltransferase n=1 Tax=Clostridium isatidis TaxID=182773 RepID=A0A343JCN0_9CLOT|nr:GNAT family N-acetyltransferase [Clostridium isatidis]ASW43288.1 phosphinothricin acetyltransferase [Clostridium isatidis]NLZ34576.1 N-acetyltransferase [Clostridiales bacterium]